MIRTFGKLEHYLENCLLRLVQAVRMLIAGKGFKGGNLVD